MSESLARQIWKTDRTHKNSVRLVLLALAECIDTGDKCPPIAKLAEMAQVTTASVRHALAELEGDKTVSIEKQAGKSEKGGRTNCYAINGYSEEKPNTSDSEPSKDLPPKTFEGKENNSVEFHQGAKIPEGENLDPDPHDKSETDTVEYVRGDAPEDKELLKELKEIQEIDEINTKNNQSISLKLEDTRNVPSQTEDDLKQVFEAASPEAQDLASKALAIATGHQDNHEPPGSALPPLSQAIKGAYVTKFAYDPTDGEEKALQRMVSKYGEPFIIGKIETARMTDKHHKRIHNPASYIETSLEDDDKPEPIWQKPSERRYQDRKPSNADKPKPREIDRWFLENAGG